MGCGFETDSGSVALTGLIRDEHNEYGCRLDTEQCCASPFDISSRLFHRHPVPVGVTTSL